MGRTSIYMVMGLSVILMIFGKSMTEISFGAFENAINYYDDTQRHNTAVAGANLACNQIFNDNSWRGPITNMDFNGGVINVNCFDSSGGKVFIVSKGSYDNTSSTVKVLLSPSSFSKFAMYSGNVSSAAKLRDGDTINGPIHFNNKLSTQGVPVFFEKATMGSLKATSGTPLFLGGYEDGVNIPFPDYTSSATEIKTDASSGGYYQEGGELWVEFRADGYVRYKTTTAGTYTAFEPLASVTGNGRICVNNGELHVSGTLNGKVTIASTVTAGTPPSSTVGATYIEDNLRYASDPLIHPSSTDMLGLVSAGDLTFQKLPIRVDGSLFTDQNAKLNSAYRNISPMEQLKIVGTFMVRDMNSTDFGTGANKGANFYMKYDERIEGNSPASFPFPATSTFEILAWYE